jgi:NADPH-dependent ferric siderophore reductase
MDFKDLQRGWRMPQEFRRIRILSSHVAIQNRTTAESDPLPYAYDCFWAEVVSLEEITPSMKRFIFKVDGGERFVPSGCPDEWVRLTFKPNSQTPLSLQIRDENGKWRWPDGAEPCPDRPYTVRRWDGSRCEITIDIVAHDHGLATEWAKSARPGDRVGVCNPAGRFRLPTQTDWVLMVTDITGLPAVARVAEELPFGFKAYFHIEIPSDADKQSLRTQAELDLVWHVGGDKIGGEKGHSRLASIAAEIKALPEGNGYIYIAGEAKMVSQSRKHFRDVLGFDKSRIEAIGYWIEGQSRG